ncbi:hypothetical protein ACP70R_028469 [Stipagrostis hirtigluma subsp. patula]
MERCPRCPLSAPAPFRSRSPRTKSKFVSGLPLTRLHHLYQPRNPKGDRRARPPSGAERRGQRTAPCEREWSGGERRRVGLLGAAQVAGRVAGGGGDWASVAGCGQEAAPPSSPPPPKVRAAAAGSAAQGRRRRGPAQPAVPIGGRAEAWWDDESVLLAALVVEDTPIRELRRKRRLSSSSATDAGGSTGSSTRKRRPRRQAPGSIPPVVLALDNEEKPNAVADGTKEVKEKEREKEEEKVVVVGKKEAPGSCKKAEASRKLSCAICLEKQNSPKEKETGRTKQNKTLKQRQYFCPKSHSAQFSYYNAAAGMDA